MTILLVDAMPLLYQVYDAVGHLASKSGEPTGARYGFLRSVRSWSEKFKARKTVICWDTKAPIIKAEALVEYKADREDTPVRQKVFAEIAGVKEMLALTYYSQVEADGYEADDLLATLARLYSEKDEEVYIATVDRDSFSAVTPRVKIWHTAGKDKSVVGEFEVWSHFGCSPAHVPLVKALQGDSSDNIQPLVDQSEVEKVKLWLKDHPDISSSGVLEVYPLFVQNPSLTEEVGKVLEVVSLVNVPIDCMKITKGIRDESALTDLFNRLEFKSMMKHIPPLTCQGFPEWGKK